MLRVSSDCLLSESFGPPSCCGDVSYLATREDVNNARVYNRAECTNIMTRSVFTRPSSRVHNVCFQLV